MKTFLVIFSLLSSGMAQAGALTSFQSLPAPMRSQLSAEGLMVKGVGTNSWYAFEVDPATGALPVTGSITATNPSIGATGAAVPASATYAGMNVAGNLTGLPGTANGLKVDGSAVTQPVSGTFWQATQPVSGTFWQATQPVSGTFWQATQPVSGTFWQATQPVSGTVTANIGTVATLATATKQDTGNTSVASIDGKMSALGQAAMASSMPVAIASNQSSIPVTQSGTWNINAVTSITNALPAGGNTIGTVAVNNLPTTVDANQGQVSASTIRTTRAGADVTKNIVASNNYASTSVTTAAYVQLIASTANAINTVCLSNSSGSIIIMATGAAASEADRIYVPAGGSGCWQDTIAASTRISMKALDATASVGYFLLTGLQ